MLIIGSSPLARGLHIHDSEHCHALRIIPARAGFTNSYASYFADSKDHPRSRGVYGWRSYRRRSRTGSSPLARGLRARIGIVIKIPGIIPARAGFTVGSHLAIASNEDHPRSRGVYSGEMPVLNAAIGSSPLARGLRVDQQRVA